MKQNIVIISVLAFLLSGCTKLEEKVYDRFEATDFYATALGVDAALANVYSRLPGNWSGFGYAGGDNGWYDLNSFTADDQVIPHRNTNEWELTFSQLFKHTWNSGFGQINNTWQWLFFSITRANLAIELLEKSKADPSKIAEARVLRAFFYYLLIDDFGDVPFYTKSTVVLDSLPQKSRKEVFDFCVNEIKDGVDKLSEKKGGQYYGALNKWVAYTILAKLYLNAGEYTGTPMWAECLAVCKEIENKGGFSLHPATATTAHPVGNTYFELFGDKCPPEEVIWAVFTTLDIVGRNIYTVRSFSTPHGKALFNYNSWNGMVMIEEFYNKFDPNDIRKKQCVVGRQAGDVTYVPVITSIDNPGADRYAGVRNQKFYPALPANGGGASNDFPIFRYADVLLMIAECHVRMGNASLGKPYIDRVKNRAGLPSLVDPPTLDNIYDERGFELVMEGHRRQDMIRFGTFLKPNKFRTSASPNYKKLFPIPAAALNTNRRLKQNPGY